MVSALSECRRVFVLFCPIIIQTISLPCSLPLQGAEGTQPLLCLLISSYILLGSFFVFLLSFPSFLYCCSCMANLILCPCLHFYMKLPCMHHMGHTASLSIIRNVFVIFDYLCCFTSKYIYLTLNLPVLIHFIDETSNVELVQSFEQT